MEAGKRVQDSAAMLFTNAVLSYPNIVSAVIYSRGENKLLAAVLL